VPLDQVLPIVGQGDCGPLSILCSLLCPVTRDAAAFEERLSRCFQIPQASASPPDRVTAVTAPRARHAHAEDIGGRGAAIATMLSVVASAHLSQPFDIATSTSLRELLHLFHTSNLAVTPQTSLWLKYGPDPIGEIPDIVPQPRFALGVRALWRLMRHLRATLAMYRLVRPEFAVTSAEVNATLSPGEAAYDMDTNADRMRYFRQLALSSSSISTENVHVLATLLGCKLTVRQSTPLLAMPFDPAFYLEFGLWNDTWAMAHAEAERIVYQLTVCQVNFAVQENAGSNGHADHFNAVLMWPPLSAAARVSQPRQGAPESLSLDDVVSTLNSHSDSEAAGPGARTATVNSAADARSGGIASGIAPIKRRRFSDLELAVLRDAVLHQQLTLHSSAAIASLVTRFSVRRA
jgi:hypothetical protein